MCYVGTLVYLQTMSSFKYRVS